MEDGIVSTCGHTCSFFQCNVCLILLPLSQPKQGSGHSRQYLCCEEALLVFVPMTVICVCMCFSL